MMLWDFSVSSLKLSHTPGVVFAATATQFWMHDGRRGPLPDATYLAEAIVRVAYHRPVVPIERVKAEARHRHPLVQMEAPLDAEDDSQSLHSSDPLKITRLPMEPRPESRLSSAEGERVKSSVNLGIYSCWQVWRETFSSPH
jgi:hypothetical protein